MAKCSTVNYSLICSHSGRIDAEYYKPESLQASELVKRHTYLPLGQLVADGYRVVYENTKILNKDQVDEKKDVRFLQATNVSNDGLWIDPSEIGFVSRKDWDKYPKGRIKIGEMLIEVKGQAEKVTIVQDYVPLRTLVTGTLFKLTLKECHVTPEYIFAFFSSKYGKILRDRTKVNTLISYVSKPELYSIPIPIFEESINIITELIVAAYEQSKLSHSLYSEAVELLNKELYLDTFQASSFKSYNASYKDIIISNRADAEFYNPQLRDYYHHFQKYRTITIKPMSDIAKVEKFSNPEYASEGLPIITQRHLSDISPEKYGDYPIASVSWCNKNQNAILKKGDLLYYSVGAYLGKTNIWLNDDKAVFASFISLLRCHDDNDSAFIMLLLNSPFGLLQSKVFQSGTSQPYIYPKDIRQFIIPDIENSKKVKLSELIHNSYKAQNESKTLLAQAKSIIERLIEQNK